MASHEYNAQLITFLPGNNRESPRSNPQSLRNPAVKRAMTRILSNGSKWAAQEPDPIEKLVELLQKEPLHPSFEKVGGFVRQYPAMTVFYGNFYRLSHAFSIETDDKELSAKLLSGIMENVWSDEYQKARAEWTIAEKKTAARA